MRRAIGLVVLLMCAAPAARAQIRAQHFPADVKWVMHVDLKALNEAPTGTFLRQSMGEEMQRRVASLKALSGIDAEKDVDSLVVCGKGSVQAGAVMYAYGHFDIPKLTAIAGGAKEYRDTALGARRLLSWADKGKRNNLCFINPTLAVMSQDEALLRESVSLIDGKKRGLTDGQPFAKTLAHKKGRFLALQAQNLTDLAGTNPQLQLFKQAEAALVEVGQASGSKGLDCSLALKAGSREMAQQMDQAAMGLQALFMLQAAQDPDAAALAQGLQVAMQDNCVTVNLRVPEEFLKKQLQLRFDQAGNGQTNRKATGNGVKQAQRTTF